MAGRADPHVGEYVDAVDTFPAEGRMIIALAAEPDRYRGIKARTLLLLGDRSQNYLAAASRLLAEEIPRSTLTVMPGLDHTAPDEKAPGRVAAELRRFFAGWPVR